jgi:hypothetical protein
VVHPITGPPFLYINPTRPPPPFCFPSLLRFKAVGTVPRHPSSSRVPHRPKCTEDLHHPLPPPIELFLAPKTATHHRISTKTPTFSFSLVSAASTRTPYDLSHPSLSSSSCEVAGTSGASHRLPEPLPVDHLSHRIAPSSPTPLR